MSRRARGDAADAFQRCGLATVDLRCVAMLAVDCIAPIALDVRRRGEGRRGEERRL